MKKAYTIPCLDEGSNPSDSTFNALIVNRLKKPVDISDDKVKRMQVKWDQPYLYEPPNGDLNKKWLVILKYRSPETGKMVRFRYGMGFSQFSTKTERRQHGEVLVKAIADLLEEGWSPYDEFTPYLNDERTVANCIDKYLAEANIKHNTLRKYTYELKLYKSWLDSNNLGTLLMDNVKKVHVTSFLEEMSGVRKWSGKTYNHYLNDLTTFFNYFKKNYDDVIERVPTLSLSRARVDRHGNLAYNDWQFKKLKDLMLEKGDQLLYTFCSFVYYGALRNESECNYLRVGDFNFHQKTLKIEAGTAKNRRTEYIPLYPDFLDLLYRLGIPDLPGDYYIFGKTKDQNNVRRSEFKIGAKYPVGENFFAKRFKMYKTYLKLSDRHGIYCYKHTRAVHLGEDGEDLYKVMKLFRHKDLATTMIYMQDLGVNTQKTEYSKGRRF